MNKNLILLKSFLVILIPPSLVIGPFLPDFFLSLSCVIFVFCNYFYLKNDIEFNNNIIIFLSLFFVYSLLRSILSDNILLSLESSLFYFRFILFILLINFLIKNSSVFLNYFTLILFITVFVVSADGIFQLINNKNFIGMIKENPFRVSGLFGEEYKLGSFIVRMFPLLIGLILFTNLNNFKKNLLIFSIMVVSFLCVYITGERTAIILIIISSMLLFILIKNIRIIMILSSFIFLLGFTYIYMFYENVFLRVFKKTINQINLNSDEKINIFTKHHESIYTNAYLIFKDNPFFGIGPKMFREICAKYEYSCSSHPHNYYLQLSAELGIIGLIFIVIALFYMIYKIYFLRKNKFLLNQNELNLGLCCIITCLINLFPFIPSGNFFNNWLSILMFIPLGFFLYINNIILKKNNIK